jgi:hypothetical protein
MNVKAKDLTLKAKARTKDFTFKYMTNDLQPQGKEHSKGLTSLQ